MSIRAAMRSLREAIHEEFSETLIHVPTLRKVNEGPCEDPDRPAYEFLGSFDANDQGNDPREADLKPNREKTAARIFQNVPTAAANDCEFQFKPVQGDEIIVPCENNDRYRVLNVFREMEGRTRMMLERLGAPRAR